MNPHRGRQRKVWSSIIDNLFVLGFEWLEYIQKGGSLLKALGGESIIWKGKGIQKVFAWGG